MNYFNEWYKENVTDKELSFFPITSFLRQIFERLVTNMLHEFCFNDNLDSKVLIRTSIFEDSKYTNSDGTEATGGNTISEAGYYGLVNKFFWNKEFFEFDDHWDFGNQKLIKTLQPLFQTDPQKELGFKTKNQLHVLYLCSGSFRCILNRFNYKKNGDRCNNGSCRRY